jgi:hypothetical protein
MPRVFVRPALADARSIDGAWPERLSYGDEIWVPRLSRQRIIKGLELTLRPFAVSASRSSLSLGGGCGGGEAGGVGVLLKSSANVKKAALSGGR